MLKRVSPFDRTRPLKDCIYYPPNDVLPGRVSRLEKIVSHVYRSDPPPTNVHRFLKRPIPILTDKAR